MLRVFCFVQFLLWSLWCIGNAFASLNIHFLDVGYGDAVVIQLPEGGAVLVDGGFPEKGPLVVQKLKAYGVHEIKLAVVTHFHPDHAGGFGSVLSNPDPGGENKKEFPIGPFWVPLIPEAVDPAIKNVREKISERPHRIVRRGDTLRVSPTVSIDVLHPDKLTGNPNEDSLVLKVILDNISVLLAGDIGVTSQKALVQEYGNRLKADIIKLPHHGGETIPDFVKAVSPQDAVLSVGPNPYGLPKPEALKIYQEIGTRMHRTDRHGTVTVQAEGNHYTVRHEKSSDPE